MVGNFFVNAFKNIDLFGICFILNGFKMFFYVLKRVAYKCTTFSKYSFIAICYQLSSCVKKCGCYLENFT